MKGGGGDRERVVRYLREGEEGRPEATTPARNCRPGDGLGALGDEVGRRRIRGRRGEERVVSRTPETERSRAAFIIGYCLRAAA